MDTFAKELVDRLDAGDLAKFIDRLREFRGLTRRTVTAMGHFIRDAGQIFGDYASDLLVGLKEHAGELTVEVVETARDLAVSELDDGIDATAVDVAAPAAPAAAPARAAPAAAAAAAASSSAVAAQPVAAALPPVDAAAPAVRTSGVVSLPTTPSDVSGLLLELTLRGYTRAPVFSADGRPAFQFSGPVRDLDKRNTVIAVGGGQPLVYTVFVGDLPMQCSESDVLSVFQPLGPVAGVSLVRDNSGAFKGYGFVHFVNPETRDLALSNEYRAGKLFLNGRYLRVNSNEQKLCVYVTSLPAGISNEDLASELYTVGGAFVCMTVHRGPEPDFANRGYVHLLYDTYDHANAARRGFNGRSVRNAVLASAWPDSLLKKPAGGAASGGLHAPGLGGAGGSTDDSRTLYVGNITDQVSETMLRELFSRYGTLTRVQIMRDTSTRQTRGYAFVEFARKEDLESALNNENQRLHFGCILKLNYARTRSNTNQQGHGQQQQQSMQSPFGAGALTALNPMAAMGMLPGMGGMGGMHGMGGGLGGGAGAGAMLPGLGMIPPPAGLGVGVPGLAGLPGAGGRGGASAPPQPNAAAMGTAAAMAMAAAAQIAQAQGMTPAQRQQLEMYYVQYYQQYLMQQQQYQGNMPGGRR